MKKILMRFKNVSKFDIIISLIVFIFFSVYYAIVLYSRIDTDIQPHATIAFSFVNQNTRVTPNFLYFFLVATLAFFSKTRALYYVSSIFLICAAISSKFLLTKYYLQKYVSAKIDKRLTYLLSIVLLFVFALPGANFFISKTFYLGQIVPNVWHNSTVIFLMPFSIMLFFECYKVLYDQPITNGGKSNLKIFALIVLNALIKPSFLFVIIPVSILLVSISIARKQNSLQRAKILWPFLAGITFVVAEYILIYKLSYVSTAVGGQADSGVIMAPFQVWDYFSDNMLIALLSSLFFPIVYAIVSNGAVLKNKMVQFAVVNFIVGLAVYILFVENGERKFHANFYWQVVVVTYMLFFVLLIDLANNILQKKLSIQKQIVACGALALHFIWGAAYWLKIIIFNGYS
jgi:hypothetical protein